MITEETFLKILSSHIKKQEFTLSESGVDFNLLYKYAKINLLEGMVYSTAKNCIDESVKKVFEKEYNLSFFKFVQRKGIIEKVKSLFLSEGLTFCFVKGLTVSAYYPTPALRTMCDIDLIVSPSDFEKADKLLILLGFSKYRESRSGEWEYRINEISLELHGSLIYESANDFKKRKEFFEDFTSYIKDGELDVNFHFIYVLWHLQKHLEKVGVGIRQFLDVAVLTLYQKLDFKWIEEKLNEIDMLEFAKTCFTFNEKCFGVKSPLTAVEISEDTFNNMQEQILKNGLFGYNNDENLDNFNYKVNANIKHPKLHGIKMILSVMFPSYKTLCSSPRYKFLKGKPLLYPFILIYHAFCGFISLFAKKKKSFYKSSNPLFVNKNGMKERKEYLDSWNIKSVENGEEK